MIPVRLTPFALLAALPFACGAGAQGLVVEPGEIAAGSAVTVSWQLPGGFEESELLIEVDGGPRVRLTDESREERPRVTVRLPAVIGTARFVVRAGRMDWSGRHREIDVATSKSFPLAFASVLGPVPVRAPASRPVPGGETEWWSEATERVPAGPAPGVEGPIATETQDGTSSPAALPPARADVGPASHGDTEVLREANRAAPHPPERRVRDRAFAGAPVPLRN